MPVVFDNILHPGGGLLGFKANTRVDVYLVASADTTEAGEVVDGVHDVTFLDKYTQYTNGAGYAAFDLWPTNDPSSLAPSGSYYLWDTHLSDGRVNRRAFYVPNAAGPFWVGDLLLDPPAGPDPFFTKADGQGAAASRPSNATMVAAGNRTGWTWWDTDNEILWRFDGTIWRPISGKVLAAVTRTTGGGAAQSLTNGTATTIDAFDAENYDPLGFHSGSSYELVVPAGYGDMFYDAEGFVEFASNATGARAVRFLINGTPQQAGESRMQAVNGTVSRILTRATLLLQDGDAVTMQATQESGGALSLSQSAPHNVYARFLLAGRP